MYNFKVGVLFFFFFRKSSARLKQIQLKSSQSSKFILFLLAEFLRLM